MENKGTFFSKENIKHYRGNRKKSCCLLYFLILTIILLTVPFFIPKTFQKSLINKSKKYVRLVLKKIIRPEVKIVEKVVIKEKIVKVEAPRKKDEYEINKFIPRKNINTAKWFNGHQIKTNFNTIKGSDAIFEKNNDSSIQLEFNVNVRVPKAVNTFDQLTEQNSNLKTFLPNLNQLLDPSSTNNAKVSKFYHMLYENKRKRLQKYLTQLEKLPSRHNYYDCQTILEITNPNTDISCLLIQSEMDVVSDGTDGDRMPNIDEYISNSPHYQPFTAYSWIKKTTTPNPLMASYKAKLKKAEENYKVKGLTSSENSKLRREISYRKTAITSFKSRSYLIAEIDPFVVVPVFMANHNKSHPFTPRMGDYVAVIIDDKIYPAILGDKGPNHKIGEASLRMAKEINKNSGIYNRPISDLKAYYLIFPNSADKPADQPNLEKIRTKVIDLLQKFGAQNFEDSVHKWKDILAEKKAEKLAKIQAEEKEQKLLEEKKLLEEQENNKQTDKIENNQTIPLNKIFNNGN